ncbi:MAG TPA: PrgI family protein [Candidatus Saccharimonadales bacterium]|nr:PrgI family protein [Candidatus Saccharimonadales bacterium]
MATYKVIQDIEAEDHILGPLSLRQFIYALVACFCLYVCFIGFTKHFYPLVALFLPVALLAGFFAFPFAKDQPTEVWALAKIKFLFIPRKRIWDQSGIKEMVTITAPKKIDKVYTDGLSQTEVKSRLHALADTIDSRGWAIKNVNVNMYGQPSLLDTEISDRLIDPSSMPQAVPEYNITASDDILDEKNNPIAQQFSQMISTSEQSHRQQLMERLKGVQDAAVQPTSQNTPADYWFLNQPSEPPKVPTNSVFQSQVVLPGTPQAPTIPSASNAVVTPAEEAIVERAKQQSSTQAVSYAHLKTIQPLGAAPIQSASTQISNPVTSGSIPSSPSVHTPDPAILNLANNNDLNVATLAREAKRAIDSSNDGEVVISLH